MTLEKVASPFYIFSHTHTHTHKEGGESKVFQKPFEARPVIRLFYSFHKCLR